MKYIKINMTLSDKIKLLFFGIISEEHLLTKEIVVEKEQKIYTHVDTPIQKNINTDVEVKLDIPFFDMDDTTTKSNF